MNAFVLINTELGQEAAVVEALGHVNGINDVQALYGIYDVIAEIEADSMDNVKEIVFNNIRRLESGSWTRLFGWFRPTQSRSSS